MISFETVQYGVSTLREMRADIRAGYPFNTLPPGVTDLVGEDPATLAGAVFSRQVYDMAHVRGGGYVEDRAEVALVGSLCLTLFEQIDDYVDDVTAPLSDRLRYIDTWSEAHATAQNFASLRPDTHHDMVHARLSEYLYDRIGQGPGGQRYGQFIAGAFDTVRRQLTSRDPEEQLEVIADVGAACAQGSTVACEVVDGELSAAVETAMSHLGAYGLYVDHASEIHKDIREAAPCYASAIVSAYGQSSATIAAARKRLLQRADEHLKYGKDALEPDQAAIYNTCKLMIDLKYRVYNRSQDIVETRSAGRMRYA